MTLHVQREMVAAGEGSLAQLALERSVAGVLAVVARQLVGARELPPAALPAAQVRLLPRVRAMVRLQVRALRVRLVAARIAARVVHLSLAAPRASSALPRRLQLAAIGRLQRQQQVHELRRRRWRHHRLRTSDGLHRLRAGELGHHAGVRWHHAVRYQVTVRETGMGAGLHSVAIAGHVWRLRRR